MQQDFPQNPMTIKILCFHLCQAGCIFYDLHIFYDLPVKKILVVQAEQLLGAAIISLLSTECDLNLMGCMADTNAELIERIIHLHPDVLIMAQADQFIEAIHLLLASPGFKLCLIWISIDHNWVHIDNKKQILFIICLFYQI